MTAELFIAFFGLDGKTYRPPPKKCYGAPMAAIPASTEKNAQLEARMAALGVTESDLEETFVRSGGPGGQNVNKTSSCVMLLHRPTGLRVKCQTSRHQAENRLTARKLLLDKIADLSKRQAESRRAAIEKVRRQKRKRSRAAKERILAAKARQSEKKRLRTPISGD